MRDRAPLQDKEPSEKPARRRTAPKPATPISVGNQALAGMIQHKLEVGSVNDPLEAEADAVARQVVARLQRLPDDGAAGEPSIANTATMVRRAPDPSAGPDGGEVGAETSRRLSASGGGAALAPETLSRFESAMGTNLSQVRIHRDSDLAPDLGARAFTHGSHIHFAPGQFDPSSSGGQHLLAHELTHVVQQGAGLARTPANGVLRRDRHGYVPLEEDDDAPLVGLDDEEDREPAESGDEDPFVELEASGELGGVEFGASNEGVTAGHGDAELGVSSDKLSFTFAGHAFSYSMAQQEFRYDIPEQSKKIPKGGKEAKWAGVTIPIPIVPGINAELGVAIGGGAEFKLNGSAGAKREDTTQPPWAGFVNATANGDSAFFVSANAGVSAGVPYIATVGAGVEAKLAVEPAAELSVNVDDIILQAGRWTSPSGIKIHFELKQSAITGSVSLYAKATLGPYGLTKTFPIAAADLAKFKGYKFDKRIGGQGEADLFDYDGLRNALSPGSGPGGEELAGGMVVSLARRILTLPQLSGYMRQADKLQKVYNRQDENIRKGRAAEANGVRERKAHYTAKKEGVMDDLIEKGTLANAAGEVAERAGQTSGYVEFPEAANVQYDLDTLGTDVKEIVFTLEAAFGKYGHALLAELTPENSDKILTALGNAGILEIELSDSPGGG